LRENRDMVKYLTMQIEQVFGSFGEVLIGGSVKPFWSIRVE
jgi:hypothetical protein